MTPVYGLFNTTSAVAGDQRHAVLGSPILEPPAAGQGEAQFGCGCFWGAEKGFWRLPGVITTAVGYAGGHLDNPSYAAVCAGHTGHAEVVRVVWDRGMVHFSDLLRLFWECHDPTQGNRQGNDRGSQYRSVIYVDDAADLQLALASRDHYAGLLGAAARGAITTEIASGQRFHAAEPYHQQYLAKPGSRPYCSAQPTGMNLGQFPGAAYQLPDSVWEHYDWSIPHCILRGDNTPIPLP
jgi:peptide-methionine (S)-S-oxide reductase